jgi:hypothetical protein
LSEDDRAIARGAKRQNARERQAALFHGSFKESLWSFAEPLRVLEDMPEDTLEQVREKIEASQRVEQLAEFQQLRLACDAWTAAFFQKFPNGAGGLVTTQALHEALSGGDIFDGRVPGFVLQASHERHFFHWPLAFPEVSASAGFDVVIGNPPFMGGMKISGKLGDRYRNWLETTLGPFGGTADLCAGFYRRAFSMLRSAGRMGMVATNTIGQGDTRESGLAVILGNGGYITFARRFVKWPGTANVEVNLVAIHKSDHATSSSRYPPVLDGQPAEFISSRLDSDSEAQPQFLRDNEEKAFIGDYLQGIGFVLEPTEADSLLAKDTRNADCIFPYLNGEDLNGHPEQMPSRYVICLHDWDLEHASQYADLLTIVKERVKPGRMKIRRARNREMWWRFAEYRQGLRRAIAPLSRVLVRSRVSELHALSFVPKGWVYNEQTVVFAYDDDYHFALLQSNVHETWVWRQASSLESRNRYTPTDCFDTFPFPQKPSAEATTCAGRLGGEYHEHRRQIMLARNLGLTKTYNLFHSPECTDADIAGLRELHSEMDRACLLRLARPRPATRLLPKRPRPDTVYCLARGAPGIAEAPAGAESSSRVIGSVQ